MLTIDGSQGEGGGQIIRTALALSTITQQPFKVINIRASRPKPGLKAQHVHGIVALQQLCNARVEGAELGSETFTYFPLAYKPQSLTIDVGTAGSIGLVLQTLLVPAVLSTKPVTYELTGGTDTAWSPPLDYVTYVLVPQLRRFADIEIKIVTRGYYPKGGGKVSVKIIPKNGRAFSPDKNALLNHSRKKYIPFTLDHQPTLIHIKGISHSSLDGQEQDVASRQAIAAKTLLEKICAVPVSIDIQYDKTLSSGSGLTLWAIYSKDSNDIDPLNPIRIGADLLGNAKLSPEELGTKAANLLSKQIDTHTCVDPLLADQLVPYLALAGGSLATSAVSHHTLTNLEIVNTFLPKIVGVQETTLFAKDKLDENVSDNDHE